MPCSCATLCHLDHCYSLAAAVCQGREARKICPCLDVILGGDHAAAAAAAVLKAQQPSDHVLTWCGCQPE